MNFEYYFDKILDFYNVSTIKELSLAIDTGASTISNWKQRNSITALKKRCRELGIYNEIFGDLNSNINNQTIRDNHGNLSQTGDVFSSKENDGLNFDEAVFAMFKRAYSKCLDNDNEIIEDKIDELIAHLMKFK